jgi:hypothetical protein
MTFTEQDAERMALEINTQFIGESLAQQRTRFANLAAAEALTGAGKDWYLSAAGDHIDRRLKEISNEYRAAAKGEGE